MSTTRGMAGGSRGGLQGEPPAPARGTSPSPAPASRPLNTRGGVPPASCEVHGSGRAIVARRPGLRKPGHGDPAPEGSLRTETDADYPPRPPHTYDAGA